MKHLNVIIGVALMIGLHACSGTSQNEGLIEDTLSTSADVPTVNPSDTITVANTKAVDSLLNKPVTTPANNPFDLREKDQLLTVKAFEKEPLKSRAKAILGDKFDAYVKYLTTSKGLKKDSDGFLYTSGKEAKGSTNEAFFLYQHEKDVLFLGFRQGSERLMLQDMKSRMFFPTSVEEWSAQPVE